MSRQPVNRELFGAPARPAQDMRPVSLPMRLHGDTELAWLLSGDGRVASAKWAPKSKVTRGEGRDEHVFTMPRWVARERGWL